MATSPSTKHPDLLAAQQAKERGNAVFKSDLPAAVKHYSAAVAAAKKALTTGRLTPADAALANQLLSTSLQNRGRCHLNAKRPADALPDLNAALEADPVYEKALASRAEAFEALGQFKPASEDYLALMKINATFPGIQDRLSAALRQHRESLTAPSVAPAAVPPPAAAAPTIPPSAVLAYIQDMRMPAREGATGDDTRQQRLDAARLLAQYDFRGLEEGLRFALVPSTWWSSWCTFVGGFSRERDIAPCLKSLRDTGAPLPSDLNSALLRECYPALFTSNEGIALPPGPMDTRPLIDAAATATLHSSNAVFADALARGVSVSPDVHSTVELQDGSRVHAIPAVVLREELLEAQDYQLIGADAFIMLADLYGMLGPSIMRVCVRVPDIDEAAEAGTKRVQLVVDLYPERKRYDEATLRAAVAATAAAAQPVTRADEPVVAMDAATPAAGACFGCGLRAQTLSRCTRCKVAYYCSVACQRSHWDAHAAACRGGTVARAIVPGSSLFPPSLNGRVGLENLGNTCFMNSALQVLMATYPLTQYMLSGLWVNDLNPTNTMGRGGRLATAYARLVASAWHGSARVWSPSDFKRAIGHFHDRFAGFAQQDAQELLNSVLDDLHEDLNRVTRREYVEETDMSTRPEAENAAYAWASYLRRNRSIIIDLFAAQVKSTLVCPKCERVSVKFDPYHMLTLSLPTNNKRMFRVALHRSHNAYSQLQRWGMTPAEDGAPALIAGALPGEPALPGASMFDLYGITVDKRDKMLAVKATFAVESSIPMERLMFVLRDRVGDLCLVDDDHPASELNQISTVLYAFDIGTAKYTLPAEAPVMPGPASPNDRVILVVEHAVPLAGNAVAASAWPPDLRAEDALARTDTVAMPLVMGVPRGASLALMRLWLARELLPLINMDAVREDMPDAAEDDLVFMLAETLPLALDDITASRKATRRWMPTWGISDADAMATTQADNMRMDAVDACNVRPAKVPMCRITVAWLGQFQKYFRSEKSFNNMPSVHAAVLAEKERQASLGRTTLQQCLRLFTQRETLDELNTWYCPGCKDHVQASKALEIWSLPEVLVIHLKRFEARNAVVRDKLTLEVDFPLVGLDMTAYCRQRVAEVEAAGGGEGEPILYDCFGVVNHYGGLMGGHYTAFASPEAAYASGTAGAPDVGTMQWLQFDDRSVSPVQPASVVTKAAYILMYRRRRGQVAGGSAAASAAAEGDAEIAL